MTAKEMFEKLGYELINSKKIIYKKYDKNINRIIDIAFFENKKILITQSIDINTLQAINKQIEELGWEEKEIVEEDKDIEELTLRGKSIGYGLKRSDD